MRLFAPIRGDYRSSIGIAISEVMQELMLDYYAHMRTQDTAVRKVFGISRGDVFWKTVWGFIAPVLIGSIAAAPLAYTYVAHWLETYPVRIVNSPVIYLAALSIVLLVTLATVTLQALRLMRTNPAEALKKE